MAFRTLIIDTHSKVEYSLEYLVFRTPETIKRVLLDEVHTIIFQSTAISVTTSLLAELVKRKIKVIFCDEKKNPISELYSYYGAHNTSGRIFEQLSIKEESKGIIWKRIIEEKIKNQAISLRKKYKYDASDQLKEYAKEVETHDSTNREGHAAKVYFNNIFHKGFTREEECQLNAFLNYGYTILLSQFNRVISSYGYLTQLGIHHKNEFNQFNLSCDLIEPFRFLVDDFVQTIDEKDYEWKEKIVSLLATEVLIAGKKQTVANAIDIYCKSVFGALKSSKPEEIKFIENE